MTIKLVIGDTVLYANSFEWIEKDNTVKLYRNKSDIDYIPPAIIADYDMLSDFGKNLIDKHIGKNREDNLNG